MREMRGVRAAAKRWPTTASWWPQGWGKPGSGHVGEQRTTRGHSPVFWA